MSGVQQYSGRVLKSENIRPDDVSSAGSIVDMTSDAPEMQDPDSIIAAANQQADEIRKERLAAIDAEFERRISEKLIDSVRDLRLGVDDVADDMTRILTSAMRDIIGDTRSSTNIRQALDAAIDRYKSQSIIRVRVSHQNFSELELIRLGSNIAGKLEGVETVRDGSLEDGRCILQLRDKQIEVSLEAQLEAFRKAVSCSATLDSQARAL